MGTYGHVLRVWDGGLVQASSAQAASKCLQLCSEVACMM